jgi:hypothetical protein
LEFVKGLDDERAACEVLERAVKLQNADVSACKQAAISQITKAMRPKREQIARQIAKVLMELRSTLAEEREFANSLEAGIAEEMAPPIFPTRVLSDPQVLAWIAEAQAAGIIAYGSITGVEAQGSVGVVTATGERNPPTVRVGA